MIGWRKEHDQLVLVVVGLAVVGLAALVGGLIWLAGVFVRIG